MQSPSSIESNVKIQKRDADFPWSVGLILLLGVALFLRIWGIWFGLPELMLNDEFHEVRRGLILIDGYFEFECSAGC